MGPQYIIDEWQETKHNHESLEAVGQILHGMCKRGLTYSATTITGAT